MTNRNSDLDYEHGFLSDAESEQLKDCFGDELESVMDNNSRLADDLLAGKVEIKDVKVEVINKDGPVIH